MPATVPAQELATIDFRSMIGGPLKAVIEAQWEAASSSMEFIKTVGFVPQDPLGNWGGQETAEPVYITFRYPKQIEPYEPAQPAAITGFVVNNPGSGYESPPTPALTGGGGNGAQAAATINGAGQVVSVVLTNPGSGYTSAPLVQFSGGGSGTGAGATAVFQPAVDAKPAVFQEMELGVPILTILPVPYIRVEEAKIDFNAKITSVQYEKNSSTFAANGTLRGGFGSEIGAAIPLKGASIGAKLGSSVSFKGSLSYQKTTTSGHKVDRTYSLAIHVRAVQDEMPAGLERLLGILEDCIQSQPADA